MNLHRIASRPRQGPCWALFSSRVLVPVKNGGQGRTTAEAGVIGARQSPTGVGSVFVPPLLLCHACKRRSAAIEAASRFAQVESLIAFHPFAMVCPPEIRLRQTFPRCKRGGTTVPVCAPSGVVRYERRPARKPERSQLGNSALAGPGGFLVQLFPALDFALNDLADECSPSLRPNKLVDAFAKAFRQTNVG